MTDFRIDAEGLGTVVLNADAAVQEMRDDSTLTTAIDSAETAAGDVTVVTSALASFQANLAVPGRQNLISLCDGRFLAAQTVIDSYLQSQSEMGENATVSESAIETANDHLGRDQFGSVDLTTL